MQPSLFAATQWTVTTLTRYIRDALEADLRLQDVWVEGEISNVSRPASGHLYFTLKDQSAALRCVMWKSSAARLDLTLQEGMAIACHGRIGLYEVSGQYQLYADRLIPAGEGALYQEFLRLKAQLEAEGLFDPRRKRSIPERPTRIGVVTSASGAALRDVLQVLKRRMPLVEVVLAPSAVQGEEAPAQLIEGLAQLNRLKPMPDVILVVRGGGSIEDLWPFNDPSVVRAVAASSAPVISGVGHETDFTLSDFAADLRAATPTAAAELATPVTASELHERVRLLSTQLVAHTLDLLSACRDAVGHLSGELRHGSPDRTIQTDRQRLDDLGRRLRSSARNRLALQWGNLDGWRLRLLALSPLQVLNRGYAIVTRKEDGELVRSVRQAKGGIHVRVSDGGFEAEVSGRGE